MWYPGIYEIVQTFNTKIWIRLTLSNLVAETSAAWNGVVGCHRYNQWCMGTRVWCQASRSPEVLAVYLHTCIVRVKVLITHASPRHRVSLTALVHFPVT
jgi:hypothetical protein